MEGGSDGAGVPPRNGSVEVAVGVSVAVAVALSFCVVVTSGAGNPVTPPAKLQIKTPAKLQAFIIVISTVIEQTSLTECECHRVIETSGLYILHRLIDP